MKKTAALVLITLLVSAGAAFAADFPLRAKFPKATPISTEKLSELYDQALIIDVRASIEYDVIHISKAQHVPVSTATFLADLEKVRGKQEKTPMAFYCNGVTCDKSYEACDQAQGAGFANVFVYDAGIFAWAQAHPEKATLLGASPVPKEKLISKEALGARMVSFAEFKQKASAGNTVVLDVRDPWQRSKDPNADENKLLDLPGVRTVPLDRLVPLLKQGQFKGQTLLIADAVGKQVQWLQYYLEQYGYTNYAFLKGGVAEAAKAGGVK